MDAETLPERLVPLSVSLQSTCALPLRSIDTLESVPLAFATGNGASTADAAAKMFDTSVLATDVYCDVMLATVEATSVTWRSALIASVTSTVPKNMVSISGSSRENSTTEMPRRSAAKRRLRCRSTDMIWRAVMAARSIGFVAESRGCHQGIGVAGRIDETEAERRGEDRPLVDEPDHDHVAGIAGLINVTVGERAVRVGRARQADRVEARKAANVDLQIVRAIEHDGEARAHIVLELSEAPTRFLRLSGQDQPRRIRGRGLKHLAGQQHHGGFDDGHQDGEKWQQHQGEVDGCSAGFIAAKSASADNAGETGPEFGHQRFEKQHGRPILRVRLRSTRTVTRRL